MSQTGRSRTLALAAVAVAALCTSCGEAPGAPIARIDVTPAFVCEGDTAQRVVISGSRSVGVGGDEAELDYAWSFSSAPLEILRGDRQSHELVARFAAARPVTIRLVIEDGRGRAGERVRVLGLTRVATCEEGCLADTELCVQVDGASLCAPADTCGGDDECGCLRCREDDAGALRCLPPA